MPVQDVPVTDPPPQTFPPGAGICGRTAEVRDAIVALIPGVDSCGAVTDAHLAALTGDLDLRDRGLASLRSDDFAGLAALRGMNLSGNRLTTLPVDVFSGMSGLRNLRLHQNDLRSLPRDVFQGPPLRILDLEFNELTALPTGLFDGLELTFLGLEGNRLRRLQAGLFDSVGGAITLDLSHNELTALDDGVFANLADLVFLDLAENRLRSLPAGVFEGLTAMRFLYLENNPGADFTVTMTIERVAGTDSVVAAVAEGAPFDMTTTIAATGGTLPPGVTTVTVPLGRTRSAEIAVASLSGATIGLGAAPAPPSHYRGIATAVGAPFTAQSGSAARAEDGPPALSVDDAEAGEAAGAVLAFTVRLAPAASRRVAVDYATSDGTAVAGEDYGAASGTLTFAPGETEKTVPVRVLDDARDEGEETLVLTLSNPAGGDAWIRDATATGTIGNADAMPRAWLARFGRTVAEQVVEAVEHRLSGRRAAGVALRLAGRPAGGPGDGSARGLDRRELLTGSSFALTGEAKTGGAVSLWGGGAVSRFDGRADGLTLDGEVASALFGADWTRDRWTAGLLLSRSAGEGGYRDPSGGGEVEAALAGVFPYGRYAPHRRLTVWGAAGWGAGDLRLAATGRTKARTGMRLAMGAAGLRGVAMEAPAEGGAELAVKTDAMAVRTASAKIRGLAATESEATRLRVGVDGSWRGAEVAGGKLVPRLEVALRHDGGDAETGFGLDLGAGLAWSHPGSGLSAALRGRGLLTHDSRGFRDRGIAGSLAWIPAADGNRGPAFRLSRTTGVPGGADGLANRRLKLRLGYGVAVLGGRFTLTPEAGVELSGERRDYTLGWRLGPERRGRGALEAWLETTRSESADTRRAVGLGVAARW